MAGVSIEVTVDDSQVRAAFTRLITAMGDTTPVMAAIGTGLVASVNRRFVRQAGPGGARWAPNHPGYAAIKRNRRILTESGRLRSSVTSRPAHDSVRVGTNVIYAAVHQFGAEIHAKNGRRLAFRMAGGLARPTSVTIPSRPFLGIDDDDREMVGDVVLNMLERATR